MDVDDAQSEAEQKRQFKIMMSRISFTDDPQSPQIKKYVYLQDGIMPFLLFTKLLALRPCNKEHKGLILNIPDTILFNDKDCPLSWFFTNQKGEVTRIDGVPYQSITSKFTEGALEKQLVCVLKKQEYAYGNIAGNDIKVVAAGEIKAALSSILNTRGQVAVMQRFVKSRSNKASLMRTAWRLNNHHQGWILSSNYGFSSTEKVTQISKFIVNTKSSATFTATRCNNEKYLQQTLEYVRNIVKFLQKHLHVRFLEMVVDFIRDQGDNWWYVNTRAFRMKEDVKIDGKSITMHDDEPVEDDQGNKKVNKLSSYTKCIKCEYCYKVVAEHLVTHKLTLAMILQTDQHLLALGKSNAFLQRGYTQHLSPVNLYVQHKVCDSCYEFYKQIEKLVALKRKMAELTGIKLEADNRNVVSVTSLPCFKGYSPQFGSRMPKGKYDNEMPEGWSLKIESGQQVKVVIGEKMQIQKCRWMIYVHGIRDIPKQFINNGKKYSICYEFLGSKVKYPLSFTDYQNIDNNLIKIDLQKIKLIYFFTQKREEIKEYIKSYPNILITLHQNEQVFGTVELQLSDFRSDKVIKRDYFKMFSGKRIFPYLSWGIFVSIGLQQSGSIPSNLKLSKKFGLLVPAELDYHSADALPQEWITMIQQKPDKSKEIRDQTSQSNSSQVSQKSEKLIDKELGEYNKRKTISQHSSKRKAYY